MKKLLGSTALFLLGLPVRFLLWPLLKFFSVAAVASLFSALTATTPHRISNLGLRPKPKSGGEGDLWKIIALLLMLGAAFNSLFALRRAIRHRAERRQAKLMGESSALLSPARDDESAGVPTEIYHIQGRPRRIIISFDDAGSTGQTEAEQT